MSFTAWLLCKGLTPKGSVQTIKLPVFCKSQDYNHTASLPHSPICFELTCRVQLCPSPKFPLSLVLQEMVLAGLPPSTPEVAARG